MTLREQPQSLSRLSPETRTQAKNEAGKLYAIRLRSTVLVQALIVVAIWASTSYPLEHYTALEFVTVLSTLGIAVNVMAISAFKTIWNQSSNRWYGMVAVGTLMTAGSLGFLLAHSLAFYGFGNWNSTMVMVWNTVAVASSIVNLAPNTRIFVVQAMVLLWPALVYSFAWLHDSISMNYSIANLVLLFFSIFQGRQVNADFWEQLASRFLAEQRGKEIDVVRRTAGQPADGAPLEFAGNRPDGLKVPVRADREPGFDNVDTHRLKVSGDFKLFGPGERRPGGLFAVAQGGVEDSDRFHFSSGE